MLKISISVSESELKEVAYICGLKGKTVEEYCRRIIFNSVSRNKKEEQARIKLEKKSGIESKPSCFNCSFHRQGCWDTERCIECKADYRDEGKLSGFVSKGCKRALSEQVRIRQPTPSRRAGVS